MKKYLIPVFVLMLLFAPISSSVAKANDDDTNLCSIDYIHTRDIRVAMSFNGNIANCATIFMPVYNSTKISGTLTLYDLTSNRAVGTWSVVKTGICNEVRTSIVEKGHKYRLSFSGTVTDKNNSSEKISCQTIKQN